MILLSDRAIIGISGSDKRGFLQGLITNDINKVAKDNAIYAAMLTPQGKYLYDFFIYEGEDDKLLIDCEREKLAELHKKLKMYKLRADVQLQDLSDEYFIYSDAENGVADSRNEKLGKRFVTKDKQSEDGKLQDYKLLQLNLTVPDSADFIQDKSFILQYKFEELNAVDYKKGCYVGQEVTARTHYKGTIRKTLFKVEGETNLPEFGTEILADGKKIGLLLTSQNDIGIALCEIDAVANGKAFAANDVAVKLN